MDLSRPQKPLGYSPFTTGEPFELERCDHLDKGSIDYYHVVEAPRSIGLRYEREVTEILTVLAKEFKLRERPILIAESPQPITASYYYPDIYLKGEKHAYLFDCKNLFYYPTNRGWFWTHWSFIMAGLGTAFVVLATGMAPFWMLWGTWLVLGLFGFVLYGVWLMREPSTCVSLGNGCSRGSGFVLNKQRIPSPIDVEVFIFINGHHGAKTIGGAEGK